MFTKKSKERIIYVIILVLIFFIPLIDLFHPGLPLTNDGKDHVARIANFYKNLQEGVLIPRWAGNLNWGYGHPILEFLYPLPSYLASLFHFFGFSFIDATKVVFGIGMLFSGICMYVWLGEFLTVPAAFIGSLLYVFTPYRFVELYVRGDIGENLAFVFMPLTLFFMYRVYKNHSRPLESNIYLFLGAISLACLILSHNAISLMFLPCILFYCAYLIILLKNKKVLLLKYCLLILLGFGLSAFFWIPGLLEGKYTLRNIVTAGDYAKQFVSFNSLVYSPWNYDVAGRFTKQIGMVNWISIIISLFSGFILLKKKDETCILIIGLLFYTSIAIFLMLPASQVLWEKIILLQNFQFPWRFLAIPVFTTSVLGAIVVSQGDEVLNSKHNEKKAYVKKYHSKRNSLRLTLCIFLVLTILFLNKDYWHASGYIYHMDNYFSDIYNGTTDTGESSPIWSTRFMEHTFKTPLQVISGTAAATQVKRITELHVYSVKANTNVQLLENTVYFPGWEILVDKIPVAIQYQDPHNRGLMTFFVNKGTHTIETIYTETKLRIVADLISLFSILFIIVLIATSYMTKKSAITYTK